jgi:teichuronic acid biosynthesis glycosyltransferase TuaH
VDTVRPAPLPAGFPTPIAGVVGQLNDRLDAGLLASVADTGLGLLLVGPHDPGWLPDGWADLVARPNVHHVGAVPFAELPSWLAGMSVGLTPYTDSEFNRASFPLKTLEYLAAGLPVVGSDLPVTRALAVESQDITVATGPEAFARAVLTASDLPRTPELVRRRRQVVTVRHSWASRATRLASLLGLPTATNRTERPMHPVTGRAASPTVTSVTTPRRAG